MHEKNQEAKSGAGEKYGEAYTYVCENSLSTYSLLLRRHTEARK
jgi:hypothetical protein